MASRVWGPVEEKRAIEIGALAASSSVLLRPKHLPEDILRRVQDTVPREVLPVAGDTADQHCGRQLWVALATQRYRVR